ncbi:MAG TPA: RimK/LysX family protein [Thermodesulfobacteriota bacterium]|nr:ATP-dependent zinc protease [Deltaproteobacteria bacterium]HNR13835.1 RimK/LysX family protein [Thermodesulfobacteriota bacterium]HQO78029.1 RimK/LysX family protein [Thermodesulfobacteriota bacterium]
MIVLRYALFLGPMLIALLMSSPEGAANGSGSRKPPQKVTVGWLERVYLPEYDLRLRAKLDTGARNSSIHASDLEYVSVAGKPPQSRVRFKVEDKEGGTRTLEADVIRTVTIKKPSLAASGPVTEPRIEIELDVCLAGLTKRIRVNLTDRSGMNYRMLLGRSALEGTYLVDVSKKFTADSLCRRIKTKQK